MPKSVSIRLDLKSGPDYRFVLPAKRAEAVKGDDATYQVGVDFMGGYSETVAPSLGNITEGVSYDYDPSSFVEDGTATLTIDTTNLAAGVHYPTVEPAAPGGYDWLLVDNADKVYDWGNYTGVPGGIPTRTEIYQTLTSSATATQINTAIANCPEGQVVYLDAGTYNVGQITFGSNTGVTLRGAGAGQTILNISSRILTTEMTYSEGNGIAIASGCSKGSTAITLASTPSANFTAGTLIALSEEPNPNKWSSGVGTYPREGLSAGSTLYNLDSMRPFRHMNRVESVVGNTINLAVPLPLSFDTSSDATAYPPNSTNKATLCGIESLTIDAQDSVDTPVWFLGADRCWLKDVELRDVPGSDIGMIRFWQCFQCEINRCYIHDATGWPNQNEGYATSFNYGTSNCLIIDTIVDRVADICETNGAAGCAYLYNYADNIAINIDGNKGRGITLNHGPHGFMNLAEGNILPNFCNDGYHGSTSHIIMLRNHANCLGLTQRKVMNLCRGSYYMTVIGNVLGDESWSPAYYDMPVSPSSPEGIYVLGFAGADSVSMPNSGAPVFLDYDKYYGAIHDTNGFYIDPDVELTLLRHGNYDYYNESVVWDGEIDSQSIPNSLFYDSKPTFFGSMAWPAIGPDVSGYLNDNPAKARWDAYAVSEDISDLFADQE